MKRITQLLILTLSFAGMQSVQAQSGSLKDPVSFKLKNGLTVIVAENHSATKVFSNFSTEAKASESTYKAGSQELLTAMLNETAQELAQQVTFTEKGGNINAFGSDFDMALQALSNSVMHPMFNAVVFAKHKNALLQSIQAKDRYYAAEITEAAVEALSLKDIQDLHHDFMIPSSTYLTIAGNITVPVAKILAKKVFGNWKSIEAVEISK